MSISRLIVNFAGRKVLPGDGQKEQFVRACEVRSTGAKCIGKVVQTIFLSNTTPQASSLQWSFSQRLIQAFACQI